MTTNKTTKQEKAKTVYDSMVKKFGATSPHTADARDKYIETVAVELAHREALAEVPQVRIINPEIDKEMFDTMRAEDRANVGAYSSPRIYVDNPKQA